MPLPDEMDFPADPIVGQRFTNSVGVVYQWDGTAWIVNYYDSNTQQLQFVGDIIRQVRTLLQDTDDRSGGFRYSTDSIVMALNQGTADMFRIRPDLFLENDFKVPFYTIGDLDQPILVEMQYIPPLVYYVVGLVQARDDEQNQDARAMAFLKTFTQSIVGVA